MSEDPQKPQSDSNNHVTIKKSTYGNLIKGIVAAIAIAAFVGGYSFATVSNIQNTDSITKEDLRELVASIQKPTPTAQVPTQNQPAILSAVSIDDDPVNGDPNAPVTIIEFSDFQCPFCSRFAQQTLPLIEENYIQTGKVKLVYRDLPLSFHQNAKAAHIASECANKQGAFWKYHDELFAKQGEWQSLGADAASEKFLAYAQELGMSKNEFSSCVASSTMEQEVLADSLDGAKYGATGTPTFFIGNEKHGFTKIVGAQPYATFTSIIDSKLR